VSAGTKGVRRTKNRGSSEPIITQFAKKCAEIGGHACGVVQQSIYVRCTEWLYEAADVRHGMVAFTATAGVAWLCCGLAIYQLVVSFDASEVSYRKVRNAV
jgi:hypothetical protein